MSEEQKAVTPQPGNAWGDSISKERKAELKTLADRQRKWAENPKAERGDSCFKDVRLTGADAFWLAVLALASPTTDLVAAEEQLRRAHVSRKDGERDINLKMSKLHVEGADLNMANLETAHLLDAHLDSASLDGANLMRAELALIHLESAFLPHAHLEGALLYSAHLTAADLGEAHLESAKLAGVRLEGADLFNAHLEGAVLWDARLEGASLIGAHLEGADLRRAYLGGEDYMLRTRGRITAHSPKAATPANLSGAFFDSATNLTEVNWVASQAVLVGPALADVRWGGANLTAVNWERIHILQDERNANERLTDKRSRGDLSAGILGSVIPLKTKRHKTYIERTADFQAAGRAYRLLSVTLRNQGMDVVATRYRYRAEVMDRKALWHQRRYMRWLASCLLGTIAGYGSKLWRLFVTYLVVVSAFAALMFAFAGRPPSFDSIRDVYVLSITSFHGRGIQPPGLHLSDALATLTAIEAFFGLAIEGIFIAAFTRRVTGS